MTLNKAKKIVLNSYPQACMYKWGIDGTNLMISSTSPASFGNRLAWVHRPVDHELSLEKFKQLAWKQAAFKIMKEMVVKLES